MAALQFVFDLSGVSLDEIAAMPLGEIAKRLNVETPRLDEDAAIEDVGLALINGLAMHSRKKP